MLLWQGRRQVPVFILVASGSKHPVGGSIVLMLFFSSFINSGGLRSFPSLSLSSDVCFRQRWTYFWKALTTAFYLLWPLAVNAVFTWYQSSNQVYFCGSNRWRPWMSISKPFLSNASEVFPDSNSEQTALPDQTCCGNEEERCHWWYECLRRDAKRGWKESMTQHDTEIDDNIISDYRTLAETTV